MTAFNGNNSKATRQAISVDLVAPVRRPAKVVKSRTPVEKSDEVLAGEVCQGDQRSFEILVSRYSEKAYRLASRMCRNPDDTEEVLQDVFVTVYRKIQGFEGKSSFSSWLYRITVNCALMKLRKRRQDRSVLLDDVLGGEEYSKELVLISSTDLEQETVRKQLWAAIDGAIQKLPQEYGPVYVLRDVNGMSSEEVSELLAISVPAVKSRLHRARLMLRKRLASFYKEFQGGTLNQQVENM